MTREEATKKIKKVIEESVIFEDEIEAFDMAIKALEQESVLDKIRAEIEAIEDGISSYHNDRPWIFKDEALAIIDKYKAESGDKDGND